LQVEGWLEQYPEVQAELTEIELSLESYAVTNAIAPAPGIKEKIMAGINAGSEKSISPATKETIIAPTTQDETAAVYRIPSFIRMAAAALIILLIGSVILNYSYYKKYQSANVDLLTARQKIAGMDSLNTAMNQDLKVMTDKNAQPVVLNGTEHAPEALAKIFWMRNTGDVYVDPSNLPDVPAGKQYQLWAIVDGKPVDAGMISTEKGIYHIQKMKSFGNAQAFAITLEKAGGSPAPTMTEMFVISKI
ncbi:MAG: anti-sigma factor, partial [Ginsengibacter sp.]